MEDSNGRKCGGYRCGEGIGSRVWMGNWCIEWAEIVLQFLEEKDEELLEGWSEEDAREWGSNIVVVSVLGRNKYVDGWVKFVLGLILIFRFCRVVCLCSFFVAAFFIFCISIVFLDVVGVVVEWLVEILLLLVGVELV